MISLTVKDIRCCKFVAVMMMPSFYRFAAFAMLMALASNVWSQKPRAVLASQLFDSLTVYSNDRSFSSNRDAVNFAGMPQLAFVYTSEEQVVLGNLYKKRGLKTGMRLISTADYDILDSLTQTDELVYSFRIRFKRLSETEFPFLRFEIDKTGGTAGVVDLHLFPYTETEAGFYPGNEDLYLGEARKFELYTNRLENLELDGIWRSSGEFDYRLVRDGNAAFLYVEPKSMGEHRFEITPKTKRPHLDSSGTASFFLPSIRHSFNVRNSRHVFLRMDVREVTRNPKQPESTEVQLENNRRLQVGKTYRIEASEEVGSPLIAELFTLRRLTNDRVMCEFRPYRDHRIQDGYLFIKDGDSPVFMTNVEIAPSPEILAASILRNGDTYTSDLTVKPGESFELRLEGNSLTKARFNFEELEVIGSDSLVQSDVLRTYKLKVPLSVSRRKLNLYDGSSPTGIVLTIAEHQRARPLDFIEIDYGAGPVVVDSIRQPILHPKTVKDLVISFNPDRIDDSEHLYGRQHIRISVRIEDKRGTLIENRDLGRFTVCPGETSPRYGYYPASGCHHDDIYLNTYLSRKTHSLNEWSRIELVIEHVAESHAGESYNQRIVIYNQRRSTFDVDVSIPAGLITQKVGRGEQLSPLLSGIGFAMMAQFTFYKKDEIQRIQPVKAGVGFLAQNAFNFNPDAQRDLGILAITSIYPIRRTGKFSFPLFGGFGYFMQDNSFFFMIGPGIHVSF